MYLNPSKWSFVVSSRKFLGYFITQRGKGDKLNQIRAMMSMPSPRNKREIQKLTSRITMLNRLLFHSLPISFCHSSNCWRGNKKFDWTNKYWKAFDELKRYLSTPPILAKPLIEEKLFLYLAVTEATVSAVLVRNLDNEQWSVLYINKSLLDVRQCTQSLKSWPLPCSPQPGSWGLTSNPTQSLWWLHILCEPSSTTRTHPDNWPSPKY